MSRLVLLGTGTCQLQDHRMASSVLVELGEVRVVFDLGRGVAARLGRLRLGQDDIEHIVFSHFHPDHVSDLVPFLHAACWSRIDPRGRDLHLYGPEGLARLLDGLRELFGPGALAREERFGIHVHEVRSELLVIGPREFRFRHLPPAGNHGLAFSEAGRTCALTGDSAFHEREIEFLRGADLAVIDAGHLSDEEIAALAAATEVRRLVCSHLYRELDAAELEARARKEGFSGELIIGEDLMTFEL